MSKFDSFSKGESAVKDPLTSLWINSNAGSGKTQKIVTRYISLLCNKVHPSKIICLTYTNNAADVMRCRIKDELELMTSDKEIFVKKIQSYTVQKIEESGRIEIFEHLKKIKNKKIFACTSHSMCMEINDRLRLKTSMRKEQKECMMDIVFDALLNKIKLKFEYGNLSDQEKEMIDLFVSSHTSEEFRKLIGTICELEDSLGPPDAVKILKILGLEKDESIDLNIDSLKKGILEVLSIVKKIKTKINEKPEDSEKSKTILRFKECLDKIEECEKALKQNKAVSFLKLERVVSKVCEFFIPNKSPLTSKEKYLTIFNKLSIKEDVCLVIKTAPQLRSLSVKISAFFSCLFLSEISYEALNAYSNSKNAYQVLDFVDMIRDTVERANNDYDFVSKISMSFSHIIVDEAQDMHSMAWRLIKNMCGEIFSLNSTTNKSFMVVGDKKQCIYSFLGSSIFEYENAQKFFEQIAYDQNMKYRYMEDVSNYRSSPLILEFIDEFFAQENCLGTKSSVMHKPAVVQEKEMESSRIEVIMAEDVLLDKCKQDELTALEGEAKGNKQDILTLCAANEVKRLIKEGAASSPSEVTVIFSTIKTQAKKFADLLKLDKISSIFISGSNFLDQEATKDLFYMVKFAICQYDDLSLCCFLRSSLIGKNLKYILDLAHFRKENFSDTRLIDCLKSFDLKTYKILAEVLDIYNSSEDKLRFLCLALQLESIQQNIKKTDSSYQELISKTMFESSCTEVVYGEDLLEILQNDELLKSSKPSSKDKNSVKISTIHGMKGLESENIVFVLSRDYFKDRSKEDVLFVDGVPILQKYVNLIDSKFMLNYLAQKKENHLKEKMRLLYVAMSRPKKNLSIILEPPSDEDIRQNTKYKTTIDLILSARKKLKNGI